MERTKHLQVGSGYIKEGPTCVHLAFICDLDRYGNPRGLYFRANKQATPREEDELHFTPIPGNVNWAKAVPVTLHQIKAAMQQYSPSLKFWCAQYHIGAAGIRVLHSFYEA